MNSRLVFVLLLFSFFLISPAVLAAGPGQSLELGEEVLTMPEWQVTITPYGGKLLFSDSPETVPADGIMYQDVVQGDTRLFFHHVNGTKEDKKITVLLENPGKEEVHVTVTQWGLGGPGLEYMEVGKAVQQAYMKGLNLYTVSIPANGTASLDAALSKFVVKTDMLVNGMYDFITDRPVRVKVLMMPVNADMKQFAAHAPILPNDEHRLRGTFEGKDRLVVPNRVYHPLQDGKVAITLADNVKDRYVEGIDATDGSKTLNFGNYGIVYNIFMPSDEDGSVDYFLNARGGQYAGVMGVKYRHIPGAPVPIPMDKLFIGSNGEQEAAVIGAFETGKSLWLKFSPPGASNLPVKLVLIPR